VWLPAFQKARPASIKETLAPSVDVLTFHSVWDYRVSNLFRYLLSPSRIMSSAICMKRAVSHLFTVYTVTALSEHFTPTVSTTAFRKPEVWLLYEKEQISLCILVHGNLVQHNNFLHYQVTSTLHKTPGQKVCKKRGCK